MSTTVPSSEFGEPAWDVAQLFPAQGDWTEEDYLVLTNSTNRLVEYTDGCIEVLPMPTEAHQLIMVFLLNALNNFIVPKRLGLALPAGLRVRLSDGKFREPDLVFLLAKHSDRRSNKYWNGADLVMEIVSDDEESRRRDLEEKKVVYAQAGIPEYWIVDPETIQITVLRLDGQSYCEHGIFVFGDQATSDLLDGFAVDVTAVFESADP